MRFNKLIVAIFICLFIVNPVSAQQRATPLEAKKLVEQATAYVKANGEEEALKEFSNPNGKFVKDELYLLGYDLSEVLQDDLYVSIIHT